MNDWLEIDNLNKRFSGVIALDDFSCSVKPNEVVGLIGPNGAGKTTLFNVLTGFLTVDSGTAEFKSSNMLNMPAHSISHLGVSRTFQNLRLIKQLSVLDNVLLTFKNQRGESLFNIFLKPKACKHNEERNKALAIELLQQYGLTEKLYDPAENLSYGQQKLLSIVCCLASGAELLLLDEPVAGIAPEMIDKVLALIAELPKQGKSVILIEHNMDAITEVCDKVIFMDAGKKLCEGTSDEVRNHPEVIEAYLE